MDIKGPEVRTGHVDTPVGLAKGQLIDLHPVCGSRTGWEHPRGGHQLPGIDR